MTTDRVKYTPPWGLFGGKPGDTNITVVHRNDGSEERWRKISNLPIAKGELLSFRAGGGGGYGSPLERDPKKVLRDVIDGYVSLAKAREEYGVVIDETTMNVEGQATQELRNKMKNDH